MKSFLLAATASIVLCVLSAVLSRLYFPADQFIAGWFTGGAVVLAAHKYLDRRRD